MAERVGVLWAVLVLIVLMTMNAVTQAEADGVSMLVEQLPVSNGEITSKKYASYKSVRHLNSLFMLKQIG